MKAKKCKWHKSSLPCSHCTAEEIASKVDHRMRVEEKIKSAKDLAKWAADLIRGGK